MPPVGGGVAVVPPDAARTHATDRPTVAAAMLIDLRTHDVCATVREIRSLFGSDHVHAAVIVSDGALVAVVDRGDLRHARDEDAVAGHGRLDSRIVAPDADLAAARRSMIATGRRRLVVVEHDLTVVGLLCLKRTRQGFCSDRDVRARRAHPGPNIVRAMSQ